ncbi:MAG: hypothetical protein K0B02_02365 [DPANN group archaeon]|nr:hypothetical protein [DPANN group archaeon]
MVFIISAIMAFVGTVLVASSLGTLDYTRKEERKNIENAVELVSKDGDTIYTAPYFKSQLNAFANRLGLEKVSENKPIDIAPILGESTVMKTRIEKVYQVLFNNEAPDNKSGFSEDYFTKDGISTLVYGVELLKYFAEDMRNSLKKDSSFYETSNLFGNLKPAFCNVLLDGVIKDMDRCYQQIDQINSYLNTSNEVGLEPSYKNRRNLKISVGAGSDIKVDLGSGKGNLNVTSSGPSKVIIHKRKK